jgi:non-heme chloroperoxidase
MTASTEIFSATVDTNDGVSLSYLQVGTGPDLLLIPGWSQTAAQWAKQIEEFSRTHRVTAVDMRGHGESSKPNHGYRISRLAADLNDLIESLDLRHVTIMAHSMGCSIVWAYWDMFTGRRIAKLILVDEPAVLSADPTWEQDTGAALGAIFTSAEVFDLAASLRGADGAANSSALVATMKTAAMTEADYAWIMTENLKLPRERAATLLVDHVAADWRDVRPRITVPTLVIGGTVSVFPALGIQWVASQIPRATLRIFDAAELGSHFMFWENPDTFNSVVRQFLDS